MKVVEGQIEQISINKLIRKPEDYIIAWGRKDIISLLTKYGCKCGCGLGHYTWEDLTVVGWEDLSVGGGGGGLYASVENALNDVDVEYLYAFRTNKAFADWFFERA